MDHPTGTVPWNDPGYGVLMSIRPTLITRRLAQWRELCAAVGLVEDGQPSPQATRVIVRGARGAVEVREPYPGEVAPEGAVMLSWTVPDVHAFQEDADAAGFTTELVAGEDDDVVRVELEDLGWVSVFQDQAGPAGGADESPRVVARLNALDVEAARDALCALGWQFRFGARDGSYVSLESDGLVAVALGTRLPTIDEGGTAILAIEVDTPQTEHRRLVELGFDAALVEQKWGEWVELPTPSDWVLRLVQRPIGDPDYEYADPQEQAAADAIE